MNKHYRKYLESKGVDVSKIKPKKKKSNKNKKMDKNTNKLNNYTKSVKYVIYTDFCRDESISDVNYAWYYSIYDVEKNKKIHEDGGYDSHGYLLYKGLAGEITAVLNAINYCKEHNYSNVCICYYNNGIEGWTKSWKAKTIYTKFYKDFMENNKYIKYTFSNVRSHLAEKGRQHSKNKARNILIGLKNRINSVS